MLSIVIEQLNYKVADTHPGTIALSVIEKKHIWQKPHKENKTGTSEAYKPNKITNKNNDFKKYESWKP